MPRPQRCRRICEKPKFPCFMPENPCNEESVLLSLDEYETIRLVDFEGLTHEQCAAQMDISRTTVTEIYEIARHKVADCIVNGKRLLIEGGSYRLCDGNAQCVRRNCCQKARLASEKNVIRTENKMKIAVTYENGQVFQHFGHTEQFKLYTIEEGKIISSEIVLTNGIGHGALAGFLAANGVDTLICGGIGAGAQTALAEIGIKLFGGVSGDADLAVSAFISNTLMYNPNVHCDHHDKENGAEHTCGNHGCH